MRLISQLALNSGKALKVTETPGGMTPLVTRLRSNYPNPFNPTTTIAFDLVAEGRVRMSIYGIDGRLVRVLADEVFSAGQHQKVWDVACSDGRVPEATGRCPRTPADVDLKTCETTGGFPLSAL